MAATETETTIAKAVEIATSATIVNRQNRVDPLLPKTVVGQVSRMTEEDLAVVEIEMEDIVAAVEDTAGIVVVEIEVEDMVVVAHA
jgi:hypothetical protein